ncbi:uncharacterized protein LOC111305603 isoform X3 [Durio zibethinus]|uniref:Uncharacterized protein LOC111305603 isoform X3 n=1 Tax=Durio zibethinus TaxID=66656 RepID=A0A6P6A2P0_DURZI|nr:uncharacterized protein LOC111305603 isoform X3 [Durio zibethinus]
MMAASANTNGGDHTVELIVLGASESAADGGSSASASEEIKPLLTPSMRPKINIFSVSHSRRKPREIVIKVPETEISPVSQFILWVWSGSRYSGLVCMALSSIIYFVMEVLSGNFTAQSIPLFETAFTRCTITLILSYLWLRRSGQPMFGATNPRNLLVLRALVGYLSLLSFIYWSCLQFLWHAFHFSADAYYTRYRRGLLKAEESSNTSFRRSNQIYAALIGFLSSITGGICYCLIKAAAKASDQAVVTVFSFGILASPAAGICTFALEEFVLPSFYSLSLMLALGILSFLAEVFLARGLQLEKISNVANVQFIEVALSQLWGIGTSRIAPSFGRLVGCLLILISVSCTMYFGPEKEIE